MGIGILEMLRGTPQRYSRLRRKCKSSSNARTRCSRRAQTSSHLRTRRNYEPSRMRHWPKCRRTSPQRTKCSGHGLHHHQRRLVRGDRALFADVEYGSVRIQGRLGVSCIQCGRMSAYVRGSNCRWVCLSLMIGTEGMYIHTSALFPSNVRGVSSYVIKLTR